MEGDKLNTIDDLILFLKGATLAKIKKKISLIDIPVKTLEPYMNWEKGKYTRNCLYRSKTFELLLLCWDTGASTPIHDHGGEHCWVYQVAGNLKEKKFTCTNSTLSEIGERVIAAGNTSYMFEKKGFHLLENKHKQKAVSLHIYARPIQSCKVFNIRSSAYELKKMSDFSNHQDKFAKL